MLMKLIHQIKEQSMNSIVYDVVLASNENRQEVIKDSKYNYTESIEAKPNEEIKLQYHVGGYSDCEEVLIILSLDMKQIPVDSQSFLKCKLVNGKISNGIVKIKAPEKPGLYDLTGWVIKNTFSNFASQYFPLSAVPRFTIKVSE